MDFSSSNFTFTAGQNYVDGTSPAEVYTITFFVPLCSLLASLLTKTCSSKFATLLEVLAINLVLLLALTLLCNHLAILFMILCIPLLTSFFLLWHSLSSQQIKLIRKYVLETHILEDFNCNFIGDYRGHLLLATSICILAVDFAVFPIRFSKTETYGWSVMDAGVGSFVFVHGLCSSTARKSATGLNSFKKCIMSSFPLFMLGVVRLGVTSAVGYHKVIPEYGMHWNFFFTLAFVKVICYIISACFRHIPPVILAVLVLSIHQILLSKHFTVFILSESRENFIEANKEGICSLPGFVAIYFCGVQLGQYLWMQRSYITDYIRMLFMLIGAGVCGWMWMYFIHTNIQPVSRRMANLGYCVWVVSLTSLQIALHLAHQIINFILAPMLRKDVSKCLLWNAINYNGLLYFLNANVMTGLVNLTVKTENCENWLSLLILMTYLTILTLSVMLPYNNSIRLKFW